MTAVAGEWGPTVRSAVRALWRRPSLWPVAMATVLRLARPGWWRQWPPVPLPDQRYWRMRLVTAYGGTGDGDVPTPDDVASYLEWCRRARPPRG